MQNALCYVLPVCYALYMSTAWSCITSLLVNIWYFVEHVVLYLIGWYDTLVLYVELACYPALDVVCDHPAVTALVAIVLGHLLVVSRRFAR